MFAPDKVEESRAKRSETAVGEDAVTDGSHSVFSHTEADVAAGRSVTLEIARALSSAHIRLVFDSEMPYVTRTLSAVRVLGVRSADPPISSGSRKANWLSTSSERFLVAACFASCTSLKSHTAELLVLVAARRRAVIKGTHFSGVHGSFCVELSLPIGGEMASQAAGEFACVERGRRGVLLEGLVPGSHERVSPSGAGRVVGADIVGNRKRLGKQNDK